jgi:hypothetical protein
MAGTNTPAHEVRIGTVKAVVWANELPNGGKAYNTTTAKLYKAGDSWKETNSYSRDELLLLAEACRAAFAFIVNQPFAVVVGEQGGAAEQPQEA